MYVVRDTYQFLDFGIIFNQSPERHCFGRKISNLECIIYSVVTHIRLHRR